jgi:hypothetical protein
MDPRIVAAIISGVFAVITIVITPIISVRASRKVTQEQTAVANLQLACDILIDPNSAMGLKDWAMKMIDHYSVVPMADWVKQDILTNTTEATFEEPRASLGLGGGGATSFDTEDVDLWLRLVSERSSTDPVTGVTTTKSAPYTALITYKPRI